MSKNRSFWPEQNAWWAQAAKRLAAAEMSRDDWDELNRRLWCLTQRMPAEWTLSTEDREDAVQAVAERLQKATRRHRLSQVEAPAHYVATVMKNLLLKNRVKAAKERRAVKGFAQGWQGRRQAQQADQLAAKADYEARLRYVVNHLVKREDREVLVLAYWDKLDGEEIARRLGIGHAAVRQRLFRARVRVRELLKS